MTNYPMTAGTRVHFVLPYEVSYPDTTFIEVGDTGTFVEADADGAIWVRLDKHHASLEEWDNKVQLWDYDDAPAASYISVRSA